VLEFRTFFFILLLYRLEKVNIDFYEFSTFSYKKIVEVGFSRLMREQFVNILYRIVREQFISLLFPIEITIRNASKRGKPNRKPYDPFGLKNQRKKLINEENSSLFINSIFSKGKNEGRNRKSGKSQDYARTHQRNCTFMNSISGSQASNFPFLVFCLLQQLGKNKPQIQCTHRLAFCQGCILASCQYIV
jgi:hypothetical protein